MSDFGKRYHTTQERLLKMHVFSVVSILTLTRNYQKKPNSVAKLFTTMVEIGQRAMPLPPTHLSPPPPSSEPLVLTANMGGKNKLTACNDFNGSIKVRKLRLPMVEILRKVPFF